MARARKKATRAKGKVGSAARKTRRKRVERAASIKQLSKKGGRKKAKSKLRRLGADGTEWQ